MAARLNILGIVCSCDQAVRAPITGPAGHSRPVVSSSAAGVVLGSPRTDEPPAVGSRCAPAALRTAERFASRSSGDARGARRLTWAARYPAWAPIADAVGSRRAHPSGQTTRRRTDMTSTTAPATFLPSPQMYDGSIAAELRQVTSGSNRHHRHQRLRGGVSLELRRGEVTTLLSRYDGAAGRPADPAGGRGPARPGPVRGAGA